MSKELVCMLIDDDPDDHEIFLMALQNIAPRITCIIESDAKKALENLRSFVKPPQYIFVDMNMPRMSGKEFIVEFRKNQHLNSVQLVAYSSSSLEKDLLLGLGASHFMSKPANIPLLEKELSNCFSAVNA
jgi:response regulator RpfG family c-di-GMP phosphodiesterase